MSLKNQLSAEFDKKDLDAAKTSFDMEIPLKRQTRELYLS